MARNYKLNNIRTLLTEGFTDEELRRLCYDVPDFRPVYEELARSSGKGEIIDRLLEHAERKLHLDTLLARAKERNPARYSVHQPYSADDPPPSWLPASDAYDESSGPTGARKARPLSDLDFELEIGPGQGRDYPIAVLRSPAGEARETMRFPYDELILENRLDKLQIALLRSGGTRRRALGPEQQTVQDFGRDLFNTLFSGEVRSRYDMSLREAVQQGLRLRLKLRIQSPELAALPWEFMYDPRQAEYVCLSRGTPVVRYLELPRPIQPFPVTLPLHILGLVASPVDLPALDVEREKQRLEEAIAGLRAAGLISLTWLSGQTWQDLQRAMRGGPWHVFHFIGHGSFDPQTDEGLIALADREGRPQYLNATQLGRLLDHRPLRLALLNACEGARGSEQDIFSSTAAILVRRGLPAVLAMQYEITDRAAIEFARAFYEALADGLPVDAAVTEARVAVSLEVANTVEWGTPTLYMRSPDGLLFNIQAQVAAAHSVRTEVERLAQERREQEEGARQAQEEAERKVKQEAERQAREEAERKAKVEADRLAAEKAEAERIAAEKVERYKAKIEANRLAAENAEANRLAAEKAEAERIAAEKVELERKAKEEADRLAAEKAEAERRTKKSEPVPNLLTITSPIHLELVRVPAGEFLMGSDPAKDKNAKDNEQPQHRVYLSEFYIGKYPVTNKQYAVFVKTSKHRIPKHWQNNQPPPGKENHPVVYVSWDDAVAFCHWLSQTTGQPFRLPTEAEWEKAARGRDGWIYPWGNEWDASWLNSGKVWRGLDSLITSAVIATTPVGHYSPWGDSPYSVTDMSGNVWEWCADWLDGEEYRCRANSKIQDPQGPEKGSARVLRGGSFPSDEGLARCASRLKNNPDFWVRNLGFRVVVSPLYS